METLEAITELNTSSTTNKVKTRTDLSKEQPSSKATQKLRRSKRLAEASTRDEPPNKKSKEQGATDDEDSDYERNDDGYEDNDDDDDISNTETTAPPDTSIGEEEVEGGWKNTYKRSPQPNTRMAYLGEFFKHLQTFLGDNCLEDEAVSHTRKVHKMLESIEPQSSTSTTIECLLDNETIWEWANARIERTMAGRTVQKYLLSLEKFLFFISSHKLPPHLPKLSKASLKLAQEMSDVCPKWRRSTNKIAHDRRWKKLV